MIPKFTKSEYEASVMVSSEVALPLSASKTNVSLKDEEEILCQRTFLDDTQLICLTHTAEALH